MTNQLYENLIGTMQISDTLFVSVNTVITLQIYYVRIQRNTTYVINHFEYEKAVLSSRYFEH